MYLFGELADQKMAMGICDQLRGSGIACEYQFEADTGLYSLFVYNQ